jgi:hypothetical protein
MKGKGIPMVGRVAFAIMRLVVAWIAIHQAAPERTSFRNISV